MLCALGLVHGMYPHHPNRLKDYIAQPKSNGYQSLHTVIIANGTQLKYKSEHIKCIILLNGIAAHWKYKEGHLALSTEDIQKITNYVPFYAASEVADATEF